MINNVQSIRKKYPPGTKVELIEMTGEPQMLSGLKGEVRFVDDMDRSIALGKTEVRLLLFRKKTVSE